MKSTTQTKVEITLTLTPEEAWWLKNTVQNSISGDDESKEDKDIRLSFWENLPIMSELARMLIPS